MTVCVAIDCMGGDHGVSVTLPAALAFLDAHPDAQLILVGQREELLSALTRAGRAAEAQSETPDARLRIHHASEVVGMDEPVAQALRGKRDSSMRVAIELVRDGKADARVGER